jgi:hypothetical protein
MPPRSASPSQTPRTPGGEMVVYDQVTPMALAPTPVPWRPALLLNMLGLYAFETGVELIQKATPKPKAGAAKQQVSLVTFTALFHSNSINESCCGLATSRRRHPSPRRKQPSSRYVWWFLLPCVTATASSRSESCGSCCCGLASFRRRSPSPRQEQQSSR